ncbi:PilZ domain-containing protein [Candidatus Haliotispira prima]|uniref:PilZ domain-containing protein n=1 Tax=Candidatus Haliotispira prima TaxID=3034016 RepID=A0ABY8MEF2_9SPIO|nr:PilZ domain-containing protein [Candidatus Haliotispira prima]
MPILINRFRRKVLGVREVPPFSRDNFFNFAQKSGLSNDVAKYLYQRVKAQQNSNPMLIFFNYNSMLQVCKMIYQQEKNWKNNDPVKFRERLSLLIDAIAILEEHFQSISAILSTYLIPSNTKVFLSDLKNSFRIRMTVNRSTPRALVLRYKYEDKNDDGVLRQAGHQFTLWLLDNAEKGYAAYSVKLRKIKNYPNAGYKEYYLSHSWRREVPNITRKNKRIHFAQQGWIRLLSRPDQASAGRPIPSQINALIMDVSLGGCSLVLKSKSRDIFAKNQRVLIRCNNPNARRSHPGRRISEEPFYQIEGSVTRVSIASNKRNDNLCTIHVKFGKLEPQTRNSLGSLIYGLEIIRSRSRVLRG